MLQFKCNNVTKGGEVMDEKLISKKELLERYKISYGALYRWKRNSLIPEEWFIKKSTVTGQETFFPYELICPRIELILRMKEDVSLDELSREISKKANKRPSLTVNTVLGKKVFYLDELISLSIDMGDGKTKDITELIKGGNK